MTTRGSDTITTVLVSRDLPMRVLSKTKSSIWSFILFGLFLLLTTNLPGEAAPVRQNETPSPGSEIKAWMVSQTNPFGKFVTYVASSGIKIEGPTGGTLVAKSPDWRVFVFHRHDSGGFTTPYKEWSSRIRNNRKLDKEKPTHCTVAGIPALRYFFPVNKATDGDGGTALIYRSKATKQVLKSKTITVAANLKKYPLQAIEIWRCFLESNIVGTIPLVSIDEMEGGQKQYRVNTTAQKDTTVAANYFDCPAKFKATGGTMFSVFFGAEIDDVGSLMMP